MDYQNEDYDLQQGSRVIETNPVSELIYKSNTLIIRNTFVRIIIYYILFFLLCLYVVSTSKNFFTIISLYYLIYFIFVIIIIL